MGVAAFGQALAHLLPQGLAWPRALHSVWMRLLHGVAATLDEHHQYTLQVADQWLPDRTRTRLEEWEAATGLPDPCFGPLQSFERRRAAVVARLRGYEGAYFDSSPASIGGIQAYVRNLGYPTAVVSYNTPFRVGRDRVGRRLGFNDGKVWVLIPGTGQPFRVTRDRVGQRLIDRGPAAGELACVLERIVPARFEIQIVLVP